MRDFAQLKPGIGSRTGGSPSAEGRLEEEGLGGMLGCDVARGLTHTLAFACRAMALPCNVTIRSSTAVVVPSEQVKSVQTLKL